LRISGPTARVLELVGFARGEGELLFDFDKFIPYPPEFAEPDRIREEWDEQPGPKDRSQRPKDGYAAGGYQWRCENWGTNGNACNPRHGPEKERKKALTKFIHFETPWSPPEPVVLKASRMFPELTLELRYYERGMGFRGRYGCRGGRVVVDECGDYRGGRGG
jgi:hypothetical protein